MILLITPSARAKDCTQALQAATSENMEVASTLREAAAQLRAQEYSAIVFDQSLLEAEPDESELVLQHIGTAIPVYVNFAISGTARVTRELVVALRRRHNENVAARRQAEQDLRSELKGPVTAMLLSCEMVLQQSEIPESAQSKIRTAYELAQGLCNKLGMAASD